jgi:3-dehydroquinate synthase
MLHGGELQARIRELLEARRAAYAKADLTVDTSTRTVDEVVEHILAALALPEERSSVSFPPSKETVRVNLGDRAYDIHIGPALLGQVGDFLSPFRLSRQLGVITHPALEEPYGSAVVESLRRAGHEVSVITVPPGEESKSLDQANRLYGQLVQARLDRGSAILSLGGGVLGDLAGFAAATLYRGIAFVNLPTTLLAQVDSSIGGKTGVNLPEGKNLVGAFHQPLLVVADVHTLRTLAEREYRSGLAEVVKHAVIADAGLFRILEDRADPILARDPETLQAIIARSCAIKAKVVEADEREGSLRAILNFGHTVGHAIEAGLGYGTITHGEAVAHGMLAAAAVSVRRGLCPQADAERLRALLARFGLLGGSAPSPEVLERYVVTDKKARDGVLQFVLTRGIGSVTLAPILDPEELRMGLRSAFP